jgi:zinc protease
MSIRPDPKASAAARTGSGLIALLHHLRSRSAAMTLALAMALAIVVTACSPFGADEPPVVVEPTVAAQVIETPEALTPPETNETDIPELTEAEPKPVEIAPPEDQTKELEPASDRINLGEFNDYVPADADPTPLSVDDEVRIGTLENGLTYYLRFNDSPAEAVEMRLVINAGAVLDPEGAEGIAHYLEHMLFNGTEQFSKNDLIQALRSIGTDLGPDLNAYTSADETVYKLDFLLDNREALDLSFGVLSQWLSAATLQPEDVEAERGIILDEYRIRNESANGRISEFLNAIYHTGSIYEGMLIGGDEDSNAAITPAQLREFYEVWYRPDNAAVIVVGDLPVALMEQKVQEYFGGIARPTDALPTQPVRHAFTADFIDEPLTDVVTDPGFGFTSMSIDWQLPAWPAGTTGGDRLRFMESVIARMLDIRLASSFRAGLMSQASEPNMLLWQQARGLRLYGANIMGPDLQQATTDYLSVLDGAAYYGFSQSELEQAVIGARTGLTSLLEGSETIKSSDYADRFVLHFVRGESTESIADRVRRRSALLDGFTVEEMTAHLRWVLDNAPPLVVSLGDDPANVPTASELQAAIDAVVPLAAPESEKPIEILLAAPDPIAAIREGALDVFDGAYEWVFDNGAAVVFVPSDLAANEVSVLAEGLGGWSLLPEGSAAVRNHATAAVAASGVGDASATQLDEYLAATTAQLIPYISQFTEGFWGTSSPDDLEDVFSLLHLYVTEPRITTVATNEQIQGMQTRRTAADNSPLWIAPLALYAAQYQDSPWFTFVASNDQISATTPDSLLNLYQMRLGDVDDLIVFVVGDVDRQSVAEMASRYVATLPAGDSDSFVDHNPGFPTGIQRITIPVAADSGESGLSVAFGARMPVTVESLVIADVAENLVDDLLLIAVREELGETYSIGTSISPAIETGAWEIVIEASGAAEVLEESLATIIAVIEDVIANGPTETDLAQAISVVRDDYQLDSNGEILSPLLRRRHLGDAPGTPDQRLQTLGAVKSADVHRLVSLLFNLDNRIEVFRTVT